MVKNKKGIVNIPQYVEKILSEDVLEDCFEQTTKDKNNKKNLAGPFIAHLQKTLKIKYKEEVESEGQRWRYVNDEISKQGKEWFNKQLIIE